MSVQNTSNSQRDRTPLLISAGLALATFILYGQTLGEEFNFINFDDPDYVSANEQVLTGLSLSNLKWALTTYHAYNWHPLTWISLQLDVDLFGVSAPGFHFTNVLLHALNGVFLFHVLRRMTGLLWHSAAVAAFFTVHPTHVESVAWISERKDVLSTFFWLLTMWAYGRYADAPSALRYVVVLSSFALGLAAKPMLVTLPAVLLLLDYWPLHRLAWKNTMRASPRRPVRLIWLCLEKAPMFIMVALLIPLTLAAQAPITRTLEQFSLPARVQNALIAYVQYLGMMFWPKDLAIFYPHMRDQTPHWQAVVAATAIVATTAWAFRCALRRPYFIVGWLWFLGTLVPVIGLVQVGLQARADRYLYVPSIGLLIVLVWGAGELRERLRVPSAVVAIVAAALLTACSVLTWMQIRRWRDSEQLWRHAIDVTRPNTVAFQGLGTAISTKGRHHEAERYLREAVELTPGRISARTNYAIVLEQLGRLDEAAEQFLIVARLDPASADPHLNLGRIREHQGRAEDALRQYAVALELQPDLADVRLAMGAILEELGRDSEARSQYEAALANERNTVAAHNSLGSLLARQGQMSEAIAHFEAALRASPDDADTLNNYGAALESAGRVAEAIPFYQRAVDRDGHQLEYRLNLAYSMYESGRPDDARAEYAELARVNPDWLPELMNAAWIKATDQSPKRRNGHHALRMAKQACQATNFQMAQALDVLAAAHAELHQFDDAVRWETEAINRLPPNVPGNVPGELKARLALYRAGKPYREADRK